MEKNNLNTAPTEQELYNAGFCKAGASSWYNYGKLMKRIDHRLFIMFSEKECSLHFDYGHVDSKIKHIEPTKAAINAEFKHFNQPLPQWEKPKPKVGEVWGNDLYTFVIIKDEERNVLKLKGYDLMGDWSDFETATYKEDQWKYFSKLADTLEDYYKEKFLKEQTVIDTIEEMNKEVFKPTTIDPKSQIAGIKYENQKGNHTFDIVEKECTFDVKSQEEKPHQYSYKGLKAEGKIPHDRSGEDHDSIEAFKKLLAICEALNGMFKTSPVGDIYVPYYDNGLDWEIHLQHFDASPIYFTSEEAKEAFNSAPENAELFKTFLKLK